MKNRKNTWHPNTRQANIISSKYNKGMFKVGEIFKRVFMAA